MASHIFAYGSLLHPESLRRTLPDVDLHRVIGARLTGHARTFGVAFPNDGSQPDKAYFDGSGQRPPYVLFANVVPVGAAGTPPGNSAGPADTSAPGAEASVAGVLIPLNPGDLGRLQARERRYELRDVSDCLTLFHSCGDPSQGAEGFPESAATFVGLPHFTRPEHVARGVVAQDYLATIEAGAEFWETQLPGFAHAYRAGTRLPDAKAVADLRRVDTDAAPTPSACSTTRQPG